MTPKPRTNLPGLALIACLFAPALVLADYPDEGISPDLDALKNKIETGDAQQADRELRAALATQTGNADILNLLGYANRKLTRHGIARDYYEQALSVDPDHLGALEYMGELELEVGDLAAARRLLARLETACPTGCEELDDLNEAFEDRGL